MDCFDLSPVRSVAAPHPGGRIEPMQVVMKFGGAALADGDAIRLAVRRVTEQAQRCGATTQPIVVVSALAGVTDALEGAARSAATGQLNAEAVRIRHRSVLAQLELSPELLDRHWRGLTQLLEGIATSGRLDPPDLDLVLSFGERMSARIFAATVVKAGHEAMPVDAWDLGFVTDSNHGQARPVEGILQPIRAALSGFPGIAVVTGFLAKDSQGRLTTLGRNGSDLTASVLAEAVGSAELIFYKDVPGILSADPRWIPEARHLEQVTYAEAAELAFHGARVLHPASVAPAVRARAEVRLQSLRDDAQDAGTCLVTRLRREGPVALAARRSVVRLFFPIEFPERRGEILAAAFARLEVLGISSGPVATDGQGLTVYVQEAPALEQLQRECTLERGFSSLALVGHGTGGNRRVLRNALETLGREGLTAIGVHCGSRAHAQALVVPQEELQQTSLVLHREILRVPARMG